MQNFPTVGLFDGTFRTNLEETGMGYQLEVDMIAAAARTRLVDVPVRVHAGRGRRDGEAAGVDVLIPHMGLTTKSAIGAKTALDAGNECETRARTGGCREVGKPRYSRAVSRRPDFRTEDVRYILDHTKGIVGFFGASSIERLPTKSPLPSCVKQFKGLAVGVAGFTC